jgi:hypothetical protein
MIGKDNKKDSKKMQNFYTIFFRFATSVKTKKNYFKRSLRVSASLRPHNDLLRQPFFSQILF